MCLAWSIYTLLPVLHTLNKKFIFLSNDKPVIKIVQYGIIFLVLVLVKTIYSSYWLFKINSGLKIVYGAYDRTLKFIWCIYVKY